MQLPAILDIEASGFGRGSYPIEVGYCGANGALFCGLVLPEPDWQHWDASAEALHGITRELLRRHGRPARWMAEQLNARLGGQTLSLQESVRRASVRRVVFKSTLLYNH